MRLQGCVEQVGPQALLQRELMGSELVEAVDPEALSHR